MSIRRLLSSFALISLAFMTFHLSAGNINVTTARAAANNYLKQLAASKPGTLSAPALADIRLAHAEPSATVKEANDYYAFNINGGGFVIIAGDDRAAQVLGYSDRGHLDFNNLPAPLRDLLDGYKKEIEFLQAYKGDDLIPAASASFKASGTVGPLIKTTWGQEMPYDLQCPVYQGEYCVVGCVATAMAQVMNYWRYPTSMSSISSFYCNSINQTVPSLPATTIDYSLMLDSYCHWDWDNSQLIQDVYTDEQAQEVAKLGRYCGQAVRMSYSPEGSGAYTQNQLSAMKNFGFSNSTLKSKGGSWGGWGGSSGGNTTTQWESTIKTELDAGRPILYSASDPSAGGHAFICDGYNSDGKFHFNFGWYGTCDGWYVSTALNMTHRDGDELHFNSSHEMIIGIEAPEYCVIEAESIDANKGLIVLGDELDAVANNVTIWTSYSNINLMFTLTDNNGNIVGSGNAISVAKNSFEQGSTVTGKINLPAELAQGSYNLTFNYYTTSANALKPISTSDGKLVVVGHVAKFNEAFDIDDVTTIISYVLGESHKGTTVDIDDITALISYILN